MDDTEAVLKEALANEEDKTMEVDQSVDELSRAVEEAMGQDELPPSPSKFDINRAQEELKNVDVLVCGRCHSVSYFIPQFVAHKASECPGMSTMNTTSTKSDTKGSVWAFVLYKTAKLREGDEIGQDWATDSWQLYQKWSKLSVQCKQAWIEAGSAVQELAKYLPAPVQPETPVAKTPVKGKAKLTQMERDQEKQTLLALQKQLEDGGESQVMNTLGLAKERSSLGPKQMWKKKAPESNEEELRSIEKIVAKRVNPKLKYPEYLIKWEGFAADQNSWESVHNMSNCSLLINEFEKNLAKQKAKKLAEQNNLAKRKNIIKFDDIVQQQQPTTPGGRPVRTSALKALDQVKEWVGAGSKRGRYDSDEESEGEASQGDPAADLEAILKRKPLPGGKQPVVVANSRGVVRVDPKSCNLSSGVYILSSQSGLIKVDEPTAARLTEAIKVEGKRVPENVKPMMIHETEVRKIPASIATPKTQFIRKINSPSGSPAILRKENNILKLTPKPRLTSPQIALPSRVNSVTSVRPPSAISRQIILGRKPPRPLPGPVPSPFRPPVVARQQIQPKLQTVQQLRQVNVVNKPKLVEESFEGSMQEEFSKDDSLASPTEPITLGEAEGHKTPPPTEMAVDEEDDGVLRVEMSPGGTFRQVVTRAPLQQKQQRSLLAQQRRQAREQQLAAQQEALQQQQQEQEQEQQMISLDGSDNVLYITPEQQQMLLQNGTITMEDKSDDVGTVVLPQESLTHEQAELLIKNGQIVERHLVSTEDAENAPADEQQQQVLMAGGQTFIESEDGVYSNVLTLDSAVQEAISQAESEQADANKADDNQMVAQIVQAEPPTPGGGPRKVVLLLPDGSLVNTEMPEEEYQALEFEK